MKTLRTLFWGSVAGALLGYLFAPRHAGILSAERGMRGGAAEPRARMSGGAPPATGREATGRFVGDTHTRVYHGPGDANLPAEENRTYFESAAAAEAAGYRSAEHLSSAI